MGFIRAGQAVVFIALVSAFPDGAAQASKRRQASAGKQAQA